MHIRRVLVHLEHADSLSLDSLWEATLTHVQLAGGLSLELICTNEHNGEDIVRLDWKCLTKDLDNAGTWQLSFAVPRTDGLTISFRATGDADVRGTSQSLSQVTQVFEACCRQLALTVERRQWLELATGNTRLQHEYAGESELQPAERRRAA